jgi:hypothetical protein
MYGIVLEGQIILFSLIIAVISCNFVIYQWIIFILGQNNLLDKTSLKAKLTLT